MNALRISLGILLAVTLAYALEKDDLSAANDAQQVNEAGIKGAVKATWPFHFSRRRRHARGPNERRNDGGAKDGVHSQKIHRRSRRSADGEVAAIATIYIVIIVLSVVVPILISAGVGIGVWCTIRDRRNNQAAFTGRVIQPAQPSAYHAQPMTQPMYQPHSE